MREFKLHIPGNYDLEVTKVMKSCIRFTETYAQSFSRYKSISEAPQKDSPIDVKKERLYSIDEIYKRTMFVGCDLCFSNDYESYFLRLTMANGFYINDMYFVDYDSAKKCQRYALQWMGINIEE